MDERENNQSLYTRYKQPEALALAHKNIPYMEIIQETEKAAQDLERQGFPEKGESCAKTLPLRFISLTTTRISTNLIKMKPKKRA